MSLDFILNLNLMDEDDILNKLKSNQSTIIETHILKERLIAIRLKKKILEQNATIKKQQEQIINQHQLLKKWTDNNNLDTKLNRIAYLMTKSKIQKIE
jgi:hypothetical protein